MTDHTTRQSKSIWRNRGRTWTPTSAPTKATSTGSAPSSTDRRRRRWPGVVTILPSCRWRCGCTSSSGGVVRALVFRPDTHPRVRRLSDAGGAAGIPEFRHRNGTLRTPGGPPSAICGVLRSRRRRPHDVLHPRRPDGGTVCAADTLTDHRASSSPSFFSGQVV